MPKVDSDLDFSSGARGKNHPTPVNGGDLVTKTYADALFAGGVAKAEVRACSPGANVSITAPGAALDGVSFAVNDRLLLRDQATPSQNGPWVWKGAATALVRPADFPSGSTQKGGASVYVAEGTTQAGSVYTLITETDTTVDTTAQIWSQTNGLSDVTAGNGLAKNGNALSIEGGGVLTVAHGGTGATGAAGARTNLGVSGRYAQDIGDGTATSFVIAHGLATLDIHTVRLLDRATGAKEDVDWAVTDSGHVTVGVFSSAPAAVSGGFPGGTGKRVIVAGG